MGARRASASRHVISCTRDAIAASGAIFAQNFLLAGFHDEGCILLDQRARHELHGAARSLHRPQRRFGDPCGLGDEQLSGATGAGYDACAAFRCSSRCSPVRLVRSSSSSARRRATTRRACSSTATARAAPPRAIHARVRRRLGRAAVGDHRRTPEPEFDALFNRWSLYQALSCRMWARAALYQSGGAYGFRDQLQDCMAFVYAEPASRAHTSFAPPGGSSPRATCSTGGTSRLAAAFARASPMISRGCPSWPTTTSA